MWSKLPQASFSTECCVEVAVDFFEPATARSLVKLVGQMWGRRVRHLGWSSLCQQC